jgi:hypothetical protein
LTVPVDAVIDSGQEQRVFVELENGVFEPRKVRTGWHLGDRVEIVDGLQEGESVVSSGTFLVDSESRLKTPQGGATKQPGEHVVPSKSSSESGAAVGNAKLKDAAWRRLINKVLAISEGHALTLDGPSYYVCSDHSQKKVSSQPEPYAAWSASRPRS